MKRALLAVAAASVVLLAGCAEPIRGEVTDKRYDPARAWTTTEPTYRNECTTTMVRGSGTTKTTTKKTCTKVKTGTKQVQHRDDADYTLVITTADGKTHQRDVSQQQYDATQLGDTYDETKG